MQKYYSILIKKSIYVAVLSFTAILSACGGDDNSTSNSSQPNNIPSASVPANNPQLSDKEKIANLENSGAIPKLERTNTLKGIDNDNNGVRDDIDAYINANYSNEAQKKAVLQLAKAMQNTLFETSPNVEQAKKANIQEARASNCVFSKFPLNTNSKNPFIVGKEIESMTSNTKQRLLAYLAYNKALDGTVLASPEGDTCE